MNTLDFVNKFYIRPECIVHVGANNGYEAESYYRSGAKNVYYVEPIPSLFEELRSRISHMEGHKAINALCGAESDLEVAFNVASNNGESSSIFDLGNHALLHPEIHYNGKIMMSTTTVDSLCREHSIASVSLMVIDVQGAELLVLQGSQETLRTVSAIYCEVCDFPLYEGGCTWKEVVVYLEKFGLLLKDMRLSTKHYGNAFFVREDLFKTEIPSHGVNIALGKSASQSSLSSWSSPNEAGISGSPFSSSKSSSSTGWDHAQIAQTIWNYLPASLQTIFRSFTDMMGAPSAGLMGAPCGSTFREPRRGS